MYDKCGLRNICGIKSKQGMQNEGNQVGEGNTRKGGVGLNFHFETTKSKRMREEVKSACTVFPLGKFV